MNIGGLNSEYSAAVGEMQSRNKAMVLKEHQQQAKVKTAGLVQN